MVVGVDEVSVVGQPTNAKHDEDHDEHLRQLKCKQTLHTSPSGAVLNEDGWS